jgi:hypothetical protein
MLLWAKSQLSSELLSLSAKLQLPLEPLSLAMSLSAM